MDALLSGPYTREPQASAVEAASGDWMEKMLAMELAVLEIAAPHADRYWTATLWGRTELPPSPSLAECREIAGRFGTADEVVRRKWSEWYATLTAGDVVSVWTGIDIEQLQYGRSHRRAP